MTITQHTLALPNLLTTPSLKKKIVPIFIPFAGCAAHCIYCAQDKQTGLVHASLAHYLEHAERGLKEYEQHLATTAHTAAALELAFYGGTFTALSVKERQLCYALKDTWIRKGIAASCRCSTRPDAFSAEMAQELVNEGFSLVEFGVQTFLNSALTKSKRPYTKEQCIIACEQAKTAGLKVGIQLMPNIPGTNPTDFSEDIAQTIALKPHCIRIYPCMVIANTPLATWWQDKRYVSWQEQELFAVLVQAQLQTWQADIPIIRMGLFPEENLMNTVLAGNWHPALGQMVQSQALFEWITHRLQKQGISTINACSLPQKLQGMLFGQKNILINNYAQYAISPATVQWKTDINTMNFDVS